MSMEDEKPNETAMEADPEDGGETEPVSLVFVCVDFELFSAMLSLGDYFYHIPKLSFCFKMIKTPYLRMAILSCCTGRLWQLIGPMFLRYQGSPSYLLKNFIILTCQKLSHILPPQSNIFEFGLEEETQGCSLTLANKKR